MPSPKDSKWYATPVALRKRKPVTVTLGDEAREKLHRLVAAHPERTQSAVVEDLILRAKG